MKCSTGFTLIELLVSISIIVTIIAIVLSNQADYTEGTAITSLADDISLTLTQAQIYGVSVREFSPGTSEFDAAYGMSFDITDEGEDDAYIYFADRGVKNGIYDSGWDCLVGGSSECIAKTSILRGNTISELCYEQKSGPEQCNLGRVDVTFIRPATEANITFFNLNGTELNLPNAVAARIKLSSPSGLGRSVFVYKSGQISVQ